MGYSAGKYAYGICDKTGFRYPIKELVFEMRNGVRTGLKVGYRCCWSGSSSKLSW